MFIAQHFIKREVSPNGAKYLVFAPVAIPFRRAGANTILVCVNYKHWAPAGAGS